uniref:Sushi domain-containing protein n=1 Tax=Magallana gigas TaxID=29159 RepID=A0A8W8JGY0_MAGGI
MWKEYKYHDCEKTYACRKIQRISQLIFSGHINTKEEEGASRQNILKGISKYLHNRNSGHHTCDVNKKPQRTRMINAGTVGGVMMDNKLVLLRTKEVAVLDDGYIRAAVAGVICVSENRTDHFDNVRGGEICNNYSTCITMQGNSKVCIKTDTDCSELAPEIINGQIVHRTYSPASTTYDCKPGYIVNGSITTTNCSSGGKWSSLDYRCGQEFGIPRCSAGTSTCCIWRGWGQILIDDVTCLSSEISILECAYVNSNSHNCGHYEDVEKTLELFANIKTINSFPLFSGEPKA